jgi:hypothetical protein
MLNSIKNHRKSDRTPLIKNVISNIALVLVFEMFVYIELFDFHHIFHEQIEIRLLIYFIIITFLSLFKFFNPNSFTETNFIRNFIVEHLESHLKRNLEIKDISTDAQEDENFNNLVRSAFRLQKNIFTQKPAIIKNILNIYLKDNSKVRLITFYNGKNYTQQIAIECHNINPSNEKFLINDFWASKPIFNYRSTTKISIVLYFILHALVLFFFKDEYDEEITDMLRLIINIGMPVAWIGTHIPYFLLNNHMRNTTSKKLNSKFALKDKLTQIIDIEESNKENAIILNTVYSDGDNTIAFFDFYNLYPAFTSLKNKKVQANFKNFAISLKEVTSILTK